jgi:hypothetical protein
MRQPQTSSRYPSIVRFRAPAKFMQALDAAARRRHQTPSDYVRQHLVAQLRKDGVRLRADGSIEIDEGAA